MVGLLGSDATACKLSGHLLLVDPLFQFLTHLEKRSFLCRDVYRLSCFWIPALPCPVSFDLKTPEPSNLNLIPTHKAIFDTIKDFIYNNLHIPFCEVFNLFRNFFNKVTFSHFESLLTKLSDNLPDAITFIYLYGERYIKPYPPFNLFIALLAASPKITSQSMGLSFSGYNTAGLPFMLAMDAAVSMASWKLPISSTRPICCACIPENILPSAIFFTASMFNFLFSATIPINCLWTSSITPCNNFLSSSFMPRKGDPISLYSPLLIT